MPQVLVDEMIADLKSLVHSYKVFSDRWCRIAGDLGNMASESQREEIEAAWKECRDLINSSDD